MWKKEVESFHRQIGLFDLMITNNCRCFVAKEHVLLLVFVGISLVLFCGRSNASILVDCNQVWNELNNF